MPELIIQILKLLFALFVPGFFLTLPFSFNHEERIFFSFLFSIVVVPFIGLLLHLMFRIPFDEFLVNLVFALVIFIGIIGHYIKKQKLKTQNEKNKEESKKEGKN